MEKVKMLGNKLMVLPDEATTKLKSGIILPNADDHPQSFATVISVGSGEYDKHGDLTPLPVAEGDRIVFNKAAGTEIEIEKKKYRIISIKDVFGILKSDT